eukprot:44440-Rhodomonas_salina.1
MLGCWNMGNVGKGWENVGVAQRHGKRMLGFDVGTSQHSTVHITEVVTPNSCCSKGILPGNFRG